MPERLANVVDVETGKASLSFEKRDLQVDLPGTFFPSTTRSDVSPFKPWSQKHFGIFDVVFAFLGGIATCLMVQVIYYPNQYSFGCPATHKSEATSQFNNVSLAPPYVGSSVHDQFPPPSPTNVFPTLFPTSVGYGGATPTGAEAAIIATAPSYPVQSGAPQLVKPDVLRKHKQIDSSKFDIFETWGSLSPWYSVKRTAFGLDSGPEVPDTCRVTALYLLHRHGARYPTDWALYGGPTKLAAKLHKTAEKWNATGDAAFLNDWTYKLGKELLTPFGRQQLFDLGISMRLKYGFLLRNFTETNSLPVFRTESQNRMLASATNFAIGFFGYPFEGQFQQSITIEANGFNNTLAPYLTCPNNSDMTKGGRGVWYMSRWASVYLKHAFKRLQSQLDGFDLTIEDVYAMQQLCAFESVALGYSKFCGLFTKKEWEGFDYSEDLNFWYNSAFGHPVARAQGVGWIKELVARLTHTPIDIHDSTTNSTLDDNPVTFPLGQSLYVDATHEVVLLNIITALNLTNLAASGPLPYDHIPPKQSFKVSQLAGFSSNIQFQTLECTSVPGEQIRIIINDAVTPLTGIRGCPKQRDGMCPVDTFVGAQKEIISEVDWTWSCHGNWTVPEGDAWHTTTGSPPPPPNY